MTRATAMVAASGVALLVLVGGMQVYLPGLSQRLGIAAPRAEKVI